MPVDLLWNGGIGTYVKASTESATAAGDRSNDAVRIDGRELQARVVGEGGNLGFTQRGRVEYALAGGRINTDFIDNSAGVNTSDVEVNLKILTAVEERAGRLRRRDRDRLLAGMTDEVAALVLRNNYLQSQAISTLELQAPHQLIEMQHLIRVLERSGELDRRVEFLPDDEEHRRAAQARARAHAAGTRGAAVLLQDRAERAADRVRRAGGPLPLARARALLPEAGCAPTCARAIPRTGCGARSSPPRRPTAW